MPLEKPAPTDHEIQNALRRRWSPVAYDADRVVGEDTLRSLFEAARWSPSSFNGQPWRFVVGYKPQQTQTFDALLDCLADSNRKWAKDAPVLILAVAKKHFDHNGKENTHAQHDVGAALAHLSFEAMHRDLWMRSMAGFDAEKAARVFHIGDEFQPLTMVALGHMADATTLDDTGLRERQENMLRQRKDLSEIVFGASFGQPSPLTTTN